jgi:hypothetical protein
MLLLGCVMCSLVRVIAAAVMLAAWHLCTACPERDHFRWEYLSEVCFVTLPLRWCQ